MIALLLLVLTALAGPRIVPAGDVDAGSVETLFEGRRLALLVGPEGYQDEKLAQLRYTGDDARALDAALSDPELGAFDQTWTLTGSVSTSQVRAAMAELAAAVRSSDDTVFVYFSTHGSLDRDARGRLDQYLVLSDTQLDALGRTGLPHDEVLGWLDGLPSRRKVVVLATCHSGQGKSRLPSTLEAELAATKAPPPLPTLFEVSEATVVIGVCAWNETAQESEGLGHDIYTWYLLEALGRADLDGDGAVTVTEAHDHARKRTYAYTQGAQRAYARAEILGADPIVLTGRQGQTEQATLGSWRPALEGYRVRVDGVEKGALPGLLVIEGGAHRLELIEPEGDRVVARQRFHLRQGGRMDVDALVRRDQARLAVGGGWRSLSAVGAGGPTLNAEVHLPRWPGRGWEIVADGEAVLRWPHPSLAGKLAIERVLVPGTVQLRAGAGFQGFLLGAPGEPALLAPSLVPVPVLSIALLPRQPIMARLAVSGGYLWYADGGDWHNGWTTHAGLVVGAGL